MGMRYLFTDEELAFLINLPNRISGIFLSDSEMDAAEGLMEKKYIHMDGKTMVLEPFLMVASDVLRHYDQKLELPGGVLYQGRILLWVGEDNRKLHGKIISIYPDLETWYQDYQEDQSMEISLEECWRRLNTSE